MNLTLIGALVSLALWVLFGFVMPVNNGIVHALLAIGMVLLTRRVLVGRPKFMS